MVVDDIYISVYDKHDEFWLPIVNFLCLSGDSLDSNPNGKKVYPESEMYQERLSGYSDIVHTDVCTFTLLFSHGNKSRVGQGTPWLE